jgi:tripartite-type tricarboxylate transporter receptor subunit TctC
VSLREVRDQLTNSGVEPIGSSPAELAAHIKAELPKWAKVIKGAGVRLD